MIGLMSQSPEAVRAAGLYNHSYTSKGQKFSVSLASSSQPIDNDEALLLFDDQLPIDTRDPNLSFRSECPPDKKFKSENLFKFRRGRGDFHASIAAALIALIFLGFFWTETGWDKRKLPDDMSTYVGYQLGLFDVEGRVKRLGTILKQSWVTPLLCMMLLVPSSFANLYSSWKVRRWRKRYLLPIDSSYESSKYLAALEYVAYFILYTLAIPILGYLISSLLLGVFLTWRLGYRTPKWLCIGLLSSFVIVVVFRSLLQIKTPVSIWLYDQLPAGLRSFMLVYF